MTDSINYTGRKKQGLAIACLILGILSIVTSVLVIGLILGLVGIILGIVRLTQKPDKKGMLWSGMVLSLLGLILSLGMGYLYYQTFTKIQNVLNQQSSSKNLPFVDLRTLPGPPLLNFSGLTPKIVLQPLWSQPLTQAETLTIGDWDLDGVPDIEIVYDYSKLIVLSISGSTISQINLPDGFQTIEYGYLRPGQSALLGYSAWARNVVVMDRNGKTLWKYGLGMLDGVDGARWCDLDGDGFSEMIIGFNASGGLHAVNGYGQVLWKDTQIANAWTQAAISANSQHPALVISSENQGTIQLYDSKGHHFKTLQPINVEFASVEAVDIDGNNNIQIVGQGSINDQQYINVAMDTSGNILWKCEITSHEHVSYWTFAHGDLDGDGIQDWAFKDRPDELVVVSGKTNQPMSTLSVSTTVEHFAIITRPAKHGLVCILDSSQLLIFEPRPLTSHP